MYDDVQLCNQRVHEFLILARTWFASGLPSKTGCETTQSSYPTSRKIGPCHLSSKPPAKKAKPKEPTKPAEQEALTEEFPEPTGCLMILGGAEAYGDTRRLKATNREVLVAEPAVLRYLRWSMFPIIFDCQNHPDRILHPGAYPL
jgi:hypothetical protein